MTGGRLASDSPPKLFEPKSFAAGGPAVRIPYISWRDVQARRSALQSTLSLYSSCSAKMDATQGNSCSILYAPSARDATRTPPTEDLLAWRDCIRNTRRAQHQQPKDKTLEANPPAGVKPVVIRSPRRDPRRTSPRQWWQGAAASDVSITHRSAARSPRRHSSPHSWWEAAAGANDMSSQPHHHQSASQSAPHSDPAPKPAPSKPTRPATFVQKAALLDLASTRVALPEHLQLLHPAADTGPAAAEPPPASPRSPDRLPSLAPKLAPPKQEAPIDPQLPACGLKWIRHAGEPLGGFPLTHSGLSEVLASSRKQSWVRTRVLSEEAWDSLQISDLKMGDLNAERTRHMMSP